MTTKLRLHFIILSLIIFLLLSCGREEIKTGEFAHSIDTVPPVIQISGYKNDTAYLQVSSTTLITSGTSGYIWFPGNSASNYVDRGGEVFDEVDGEVRCTEIPLEVTGTVNNKFPGTYILYYNAKDAAGNSAATVTRTVHVVENNTAFLNGNYDVTCSCTAMIVGGPNSTITATQYTATATASGKVNNNFQLSALRIGPEDVVASNDLSGYSINISFYNPSFLISNGSSGTLSATRNSFTIETLGYQFNPNVTYQCKNVYTKIK